MNSPERTTETDGSRASGGSPPPPTPPQPPQRWDYRTSHQVLDHLRQHFHHRDVPDASQGHGGGGQDEVSSQDGLKERENDPASSGEQEVLSRFQHTHLLFTPNFIDGCLSPPPVGPVDDVVVHQAGGVDHL